MRGDAVRLLTAHRSKGLRVAAGRRRRRCRRAPGPTCAAAPRCCSPSGSAPATALPPVADLGAARRGAPAVLRGLHPRPRAARGHRRRVARGRRRPALAVPRRARRGAGPRCRAARCGRCRSPAWSPSCAARVADPARSPSRCAARPPAGSRCWPRPTERDQRAGAAGRPRPVVGRARPQPVAAGRSGPSTSRWRCRPARSSRSWPARRSGSSSGRPAAARRQRLPGLRPGRARPRRPGRQGRARRACPS